MNSDKFDRIVLDLLYGELDELTSAAARRHMEQSARAREIFAHFKATRQLSVLPAHSPPSNFEASLMERERGALAELPVHHRVGRIISMLAGYAMRPQLIMGALLLLMIGSSLMFLRARPGQHSAMQVTERGAPEADTDLVLPVPEEAPPAVPTSEPSGVFQSPAPPPLGGSGSPPGEATAPLKPSATGAAPLPATAEALGEGLDPFDQAVRMYRAGQYVEAQRRFERISRGGGPHAPEAALYSAQAVRNVSGCAPAVSRFERVRLRFPGSGSAYEAAWRAAKCLYQLGDVEAARQSYEALLQVSSHAERARAALAALGGAPAVAMDIPPTPREAARELPSGTEADVVTEPAKDGADASGPGPGSATATAPPQASPDAPSSPGLAPAPRDAGEPPAL